MKDYEGEDLRGYGDRLVGTGPTNLEKVALIAFAALIFLFVSFTMGPMVFNALGAGSAFGGGAFGTLATLSLTGITVAGTALGGYALAKATVGKMRGESFVGTLASIGRSKADINKDKSDEIMREIMRGKTAFAQERLRLENRIGLLKEAIGSVKEVEKAKSELEEEKEKHAESKETKEAQKKLDEADDKAKGLVELVTEEDIPFSGAKGGKSLTLFDSSKSISEQTERVKGGLKRKLDNCERELRRAEDELGLLDDHSVKVPPPVGNPVGKGKGTGRSF